MATTLTTQAWGIWPEGLLKDDLIKQLDEAPPKLHVYFRNLLLKERLEGRTTSLVDVTAQATSCHNTDLAESASYIWGPTAWTT